ncbi:MAG: FkbM family methyltransferase [Polyangiaceae bacterium]|nr:FkbM family methyltransferase [Polyangiaceae bacterium]
MGRDRQPPSLPSAPAAGGHSLGRAPRGLPCPVHSTQGARTDTSSYHRLATGTHEPRPVQDPHFREIEMVAGDKAIDELLAQVSPFLCSRPITYVEVGAASGGMFAYLAGTPLRVREAHLFEASPAAYEALLARVRDAAYLGVVHVHNVALGPAVDRSPPPNRGAVPGGSPQTNTQDSMCVPASTLDEFCAELTEQHIALLVMDVDASEAFVLEGASQLLARQRIDVAYIRARIGPGADRDGIRRIDDLMQRHGYRLFGVFGQEHERVDDLPMLRSAGFAYMSTGLAHANPLRLTKEVREAHGRIRALSQEVESLSARAKDLEKALREAQTERQRALQELAGLSDRHATLERHSKIECEELRSARRALAAMTAANCDMSRSAAMVEARSNALDQQLAQSAREAAELAARLRASEIARAEQALELLSTRGESARLAADLDTLRRRRIDAQQKRPEPAQVPPASTTTTKNSSKVARQLETVSAELQVAQKTLQEVFAVFDALYRSEEKAREAASAAFDQAELTRSQLSYRIGACLAAHSRSARGWLGMPNALIEAIREPPQPPGARATAPAARRLSVGEPHACPLQRDCRVLSVTASREPLTLRARVLGVSSSAKLALEIALASPVPLPPPTVLAGSTLDPPELVGAAKRSVKQRSGDTLELLSVPYLDADVTLSVRVAGEEPCILSLLLRGARSSEVPAVQSRAPAHGPPGATKPASRLNPRWPRHQSSRTVWQAYGLIRAGHVQSGIAFAEHYAADIERPVINLLRANQCLDDEAKWLSLVNEYLRQFGIARIELLPGTAPRFYRITAAPKLRVDNGPLVSVIMPAFNAERTLRRAAESLLAQTWRPLELTIVDDASTDNTFAVAKALAESDPRVTVLRNRANVGPYVSKNLALRVVRGRFIAGHDADDWAHPQAIQNQCEAMLRSDGEIQASLTRMLRTTEAGEIVSFAKIGRSSDDGARRLASISCMFEADVLRTRLGYWDSIRFGADTELIARAERVLGSGVVHLNQLGRLCLDAEGSLSNDPVYGVDKLRGASPTRLEYRTAWQAWHESLAYGEGYLPFPQHRRVFAAPEVALVPLSSVLANLAAMTVDTSGPERATEEGP